MIVNASKYSRGAFVILSDGDPVHIPLQVTQKDARELSAELHTLTIRATKADATKQFAFFLRKLWDQIVSPIIDFLQTILVPQSRIWWCPTAEFSALHLHAAGPYRKGQLNLTDLYISSYTPTLTAPIHARRREAPDPKTEGKRFVAIGQARALEESELLSVGTELSHIGQRISGLATFTRLDGTESSVFHVAQELGRNGWLYLACHGLPDRKHPLDSAFALQDGHFAIQRRIGCNAENSRVCVSVCVSYDGRGRGESRRGRSSSRLRRSSLGFRSVIGTMWAVDDGATNKIASTFYSHMVDASGRLDYTYPRGTCTQTKR